MKTCSCCKKEKALTEFNLNNRAKDKLCSKCKECFKFYRDANKEKLKIYFKQYHIKNRKFHVDHIIPLQHELVCGLHVENNLQIISAERNMRKNNSFVPIVEDVKWRK